MAGSMLVGGKIGLTVKGMKNNVLACLSSVLNCIPLSFRICIYIYIPEVGQKINANLAQVHRYPLIFHLYLVVGY